MQSTAGNAAVARLAGYAIAVQRDQDTAERGTPPSQPVTAALHHVFRLHHTPHGLAFDRQTADNVAIANHEARAHDGVNTTIDLSTGAAQLEIFRHLHGLNALESRRTMNEHPHITFTTANEYFFVATEWNDGDPRPYQMDRGYATFRMQWVPPADHAGYYQIYHLDGMS